MAKTLKLEFESYSPYENLAAEEIFCEMCARAGKVGIFLWQNADTVVIGQNQNPWRECNLAEMGKDSVRLARRKTGGGAVFHDLGNLNFSFCAARGEYDRGAERVAREKEGAEGSTDCAARGEYDRGAESATRGIDDQDADCVTRGEYDRGAEGSTEGARKDAGGSEEDAAREIDSSAESADGGAEYSQEKNYRVIVGAVRKAGIAAEISGRNDITAQGRKFSGNAFRFTSRYSLAHGTLLVSSQLSRLSRYLTPSANKLKGKGVKSVQSRVVNLSEFAPIDVETLKALIEREFAEVYGDFEVVYPDREAVKRLAAEYSSWEFLYGQTPEFEIELSRRFSFGEITAGICLKNGRIADCAVWSDMLDASLPPKIAACLKGRRYEKSDMLAALETLSEHPEILQIISEMGED